MSVVGVCVCVCIVSCRVVSVCHVNALIVFSLCFVYMCSAVSWTDVCLGDPRTCANGGSGIMVSYVYISAQSHNVSRLIFHNIFMSKWAGVRAPHNDVD